MKYASGLLLSLGAILLILATLLFWQRYDPERLAFAKDFTSSDISSINTSLTPRQILIPDLKIDLNIVPSSIEAGKWQASSKSVSYLTSTALPGSKGNSVLYAHNWPSLLGNLKNIQKGQEIFIKYDDGSTKSFKVSEIKEVNPSQTEVLNQTEDSRLTIYTCSGFFDSKRFVVVAI